MIHAQQAALLGYWFQSKCILRKAQESLDAHLNNYIDICGTQYSLQCKISSSAA